MTPETHEAAPDIVAFDEPLPPGADATALLGGKGAGLAQMSRELGLPVPPGFTITTETGRRYLSGGWPDGLDERISEHLDRIGERLGRRFGDPDAPLLVSVRSGGPVSMPGMMDTLLNVGMTEAIRERLAEESGSEAFAADTWLRFHRMYAEIVLGLPKAAIDEAAGAPGSATEVLEAAERVRVLAQRQAGAAVPSEPMAQLRGAIEAVFRSWKSERARVFREREGIDHDLCSAATVQAMVFGNLDEWSGTGVVFTRDPATGEATPFGDYLPRAQGDDVVAGTHAVQSLEALRRQLPEVHEQLLGVLRRLEHHYADMCDVEFTVSAGALYLLQTRVGRRSPLAAVRLAVAMAEDPAFPLTREQAVARVDHEMLQRLASLGRIDPLASPVGTGLAASPGIAAGALCCDADRAATLASEGHAVVLAREETSPSDVHGMVGAAAVVTTRGGVASHAAVVARGWGIPAVTSLEAAEVRADGLAVGDVFIAEGATVTVDGSTGTVYRGDRRVEGAAEVPEVRTLREWARALAAGTLAASHAPAVVAGAEAEVEREASLFEVLRAVELKGLCSVEQAARCLGTSVAVVERRIEERPEFVQSTPRGWFLTPEGRAWTAAQIEAERASLEREAFEACYRRFVDLNGEFKRLVSEWQQAPGTDATSPEWSDVVERLGRIDEAMREIVEESAAVERLALYGRRFGQAFEALRAGDASMLASPLKESYHTVWFEYHEELIALLGLDRAAEEAAEERSRSPAGG